MRVNSGGTKLTEKNFIETLLAVFDNGTAYSSSAAGYARMVIDRAGQAGYLTGV